MKNTEINKVTDDQARAVYFFTRLALIGDPFVPTFCRKVLGLVRDNKPIPTEGKCIGAVKRQYEAIERLFEDCSTDYRRNIIDLYLEAILPRFEELEQKEDEQEAAIDELVNLLCNRSIVDIISITEQLKATMV